MTWSGLDGRPDPDPGGYSGGPGPRRGAGRGRSTGDQLIGRPGRRTRRCPSARSGSAVSAPPTPDGVDRAGRGTWPTTSISAVVDATHPFAATISANTVAAAERTGTPLLRLQRPGWRDHPDADRWTWVDHVDAGGRRGAGSQAAVPDHRAAVPRPVPALGRRDVTVRVVDPPEFGLPERWRLIRSRGPYAYADELALMRDAGSDLLVTKDSGGSHTAAKLDAARDLGIRVVVVDRPPSRPGVDAGRQRWPRR